MHRAQSFADCALAGMSGRAISTRTLTAHEAVAFASSLQDDARDAFYSGVLSIGEAIQGLNRQLYSWTTVKLYYSVFYLVRAALGLYGTGIIYWDRTPYAWTAAAGEKPIKRSGTTHKAVLDAFKHYRSGSVLLSQSIGPMDSFDWLMTKRESVNYKVPKFCEPNAPSHFESVVKNGVRRLVSAYIADQSHLYTFDPDHAMLAFPVATLKTFLADLKTLSVRGIPPQDVAYLASQAFDKKGPLPEFRTVLLGS